MRNNVQQNNENDFFNEEKKIMRLTAIGMVADGKINDNEKRCITEIILKDYLDGKIHDLDNFIPNSLDKSKIQIERHGDITSIIYPNWNIDISCEDNQIWNKLKNDKLLNEDEIIQCYAKSRYYVECIAQRLEKPNVQQGLYVNIDALSFEDVLLELRESILVFKADKLIAESERAAFISTALVMNIKNPDKLWIEWIGKSKEQLLDDNIISNTRKIIEYDKEVDSNDVETIEQSIITYNIKGPLKYGLRNAIDNKLHKHTKLIEQRNKMYSRVALIIFALTAFLIYKECTISVETKIIQKEHKEFTELSYENSQMAKNLINEGHYNITKENANIEELSQEDKLLYYQKGVSLLKTDGEKNFKINFMWIPLGIIIIITFRTVLLKLIEKTRFLSLKMWYLKYINNVRINHVVILMIVIILSAFFIYRMNSSSYVSMIYNSILVLMMMLSIEIMIFMRERYSKKIQEHHSSGIIIVLVAFAIIADFCIGFIEIPYDCITWELLFNKIASALLLGCISFFTGKFLEINSMQKQIEIDYMYKMINNINNYLSDNK